MGGLWVPIPCHLFLGTGGELGHGSHGHGGSTWVPSSFLKEIGKMGGGESILWGGGGLHTFPPHSGHTVACLGDSLESGALSGVSLKEPGVEHSHKRREEH